MVKFVSGACLRVCSTSSINFCMFCLPGFARIKFEPQDFFVLPQMDKGRSTKAIPFREGSSHRPGTVLHPVRLEEPTASFCNSIADGPAKKEGAGMHIKHKPTGEERIQKFINRDLPAGPGERRTIQRVAARPWKPEIAVLDGSAKHKVRVMASRRLSKPLKSAGRGVRHHLPT